MGTHVEVALLTWSGTLESPGTSLLEVPMHPPVRNSELGDFSKLLGPVVSGNSGHISITRGACPHPDQFIRTSWGGGRGWGREQQPGMSIFENCLKNSNTQVKDPHELNTATRLEKVLVDNFCICEGCSVPRCLMYEIYVETCGQNTENQVNPATFGKLVRLVFPDLGTRRLGTRGSARYHYDGICIKKSSFFYAQYSYLIGEKRYHSGDAIAFEKSTNYNSIIQQEATGIEDVLLHDFLEDVSIQYLKSVRLFSKKLKLWLLNALEGFPALLQISKLKEVTLFVKRLRRKTYLSNMAKTMRTVLKSKRRVGVLKSDVQAIINQATLATSKKALASDRSDADELENNPEMKCLRNLVSLLGTSTDLSVFLSCLSSHLQAFVFQPSRSKEEFIKLAAGFQLRWNLLLTAVSKAMTLCHRESFGSWHLFHLLLLEYVIHTLQSCLEEEEEEEDMGNVKEMLPDDPTLGQPDQALFHPLNSSWPQTCACPSVESLGVTPTHVDQGRYPVGVSNMVLRILGFLVDTATGNKVPALHKLMVYLTDGRRRASVGI
ncbi:DNA-binding protein RFX8 isoform X2 [Macaca nemestrina]|uniref:DNA-binding protein RFX8 isoform X2 n=1 Tax=Macaca nemestrina TaxID=9545 RepID=UPI0039B90081